MPIPSGFYQLVPQLVAEVALFSYSFRTLKTPERLTAQ